MANNLQLQVMFGVERMTYLYAMHPLYVLARFILQVDITLTFVMQGFYAELFWWKDTWAPHHLQSWAC